MECDNHFAKSFPYLIMSGTSAANQGPKAIAKAWAIPNLGVCLAHKGEKWISWQIFPPLYIFIVFPYNSGSSISIGLLG